MRPMVTIAEVLRVFFDKAVDEIGGRQVMAKRLDCEPGHVDHIRAGRRMLTTENLEKVYLSTERTPVQVLKDIARQAALMEVNEEITPPEALEKRKIKKDDEEA